MAIEPKRSRTRKRGFTLLETLVALGIVSILIATLIPISRTTLFRIVTLGEYHDLISAFERVNLETADKIENSEQREQGVTTKITKRALPPFQYENKAVAKWQPVLVTIESRTPHGAVLRTEIIRLEREQQ